MTAEQPDRDEEALKRFGRPGGNGEDKHASEWPPALDLERLAENEPEQPRFIIPDWLPAGYATLLAGHGGVGKSAIALHLAVCIASGAQFFGLDVQRRRVLYLSCEDREQVLHWRLARICAYAGQDLAALRGWLQIIDLVGHDVILWDRSPATGNALTSAYGILAERITAGTADVIMVDGISDTFGGNENARGDVKRFVNSLVSLIQPQTGAVLLIGHVPKPSSRSGADAGEGYSGSTGWHNSARARWYLYPDKQADEDPQAKAGALTLELQKSNLGRTDQALTFRWDTDANLFLADTTPLETHFDRAHRDREEQAGILAALKSCASASPAVVVPAATTGRRTGYNVLSVQALFPQSLRCGKPGIHRFWHQVEVLRANGSIGVAAHKSPDRHFSNQLIVL